MVAGSQRDRVMAACGTKPGSAEDYPFGDEVAVFKVAGRMFALVPLGQPPGSVSLKCDPHLAEGLRARNDDDCNVLCLSARSLTMKEAEPIITAWISTPFAGAPRFKRRIEEIDQLG